MQKDIFFYNGTVKLSFEERDWNGKKIHVYKDEEGNRIESNTGATGIIDKSTPLMYWATKLMGLYLYQNYIIKAEPITLGSIELAQKKWRDAKEEAADLGTEIHEWIDKWINLKKIPPMPENEKVLNGVNAFLKWHKENQVEFIANERIVYSKKHNVIGKLDLISYDTDDKFLSLDDFKSSKGIYPEMVLQTAGYLMMIEEEIEYLLSIPFKSIKSDDDKKLVELYKKSGGFGKRRILRFGKEDGEFEVREFTEHKNDIKGFLSAFALKTRVGELEKELKQYGKL